MSASSLRRRRHGWGRARISAPPLVPLTLARPGARLAPRGRRGARLAVGLRVRWVVALTDLLPRRGPRSGEDVQERSLVLHDLPRDLLERPTEAHLHGQAPGGCVPVLRDRLQLGGALPGPGRPPLGVLRRPFFRGYAGEGPCPADRLDPINHAEYPPRVPRVLAVVTRGTS